MYRTVIKPITKIYPAFCNEKLKDTKNQSTNYYRRSGNNKNEFYRLAQSHLAFYGPQQTATGSRLVVAGSVMAGSSAVRNSSVLRGRTRAEFQFARSVGLLHQVSDLAHYWLRVALAGLTPMGVTPFAMTTVGVTHARMTSIPITPIRMTIAMTSARTTPVAMPAVGVAPIAVIPIAGCWMLKCGDKISHGFRAPLTARCMAA
jgi:hypothetical protein